MVPPKRSAVPPPPPLVPSKKKSKDAVKGGRALVNDRIARDSSRILRPWNSVSLLSTPAETLVMTREGAASASTMTEGAAGDPSNRSEDIAEPDRGVQAGRGSNPRVLPRTGRWRRLQQGTPSELAEATRRVKCRWISTMENGCAGLCVPSIVADGDGGGVEENDDRRPDDSEVTHVYTALVHGIVPDDWTGDKIRTRPPKDGAWPWKNKRGVDDGKGPSGHPIMNDRF